MAHRIKKSAALGVTVPQSAVNIKAVIERQQEIVKSFRNGSESQLASGKNLWVVYGEASFSAPGRLKINLNNGKVDEAQAN